MKLKDYREQFERNLKVMSRTANGILDVSASAAKIDSMATDNAEDAKKSALSNTMQALDFLFYCRGRNFRSKKELELLVLQAAEIANRGIVKNGRLFRSGEYSATYHHVIIKDIPAVWGWFIDAFYKLLKYPCFEPEEIAAFTEYMINTVGHFFTDGCGRISMLISTYVLMRFDLPCPIYNSREEYYNVAERSTVLTVGDARLFVADVEFQNFVSYYKSLCPSKARDFNSYIEKQDDGVYVCHLIGYLIGNSHIDFSSNIADFYEKYGDILMIFDGSELMGIDSGGTGVLKSMKASGKRFVLKDLNIDCMVLLKVEGLGTNFDQSDTLPQVDLSGCPIINEGENGIVYRLSDEVVAKIFKKDPDYDVIIGERVSMRNALVCGIPAPISFGYAEYNGALVILMELVESRSIMQIIRSEEDYDEYIIRYADFVKKLHEIRDEEKLKYFVKNKYEERLFAKADRTDSVLPKEYKGRARELLEKFREQECLIHGDVHPNNIMVRDDEMMFIDFDTFSTGKAVYDLGALYRALLCEENAYDGDYNFFLKIPDEDCQRIWDLFIREYYKDESDAVKQQKLNCIKLIGVLLDLAKKIKIEAPPEALSIRAARLMQILDEAEAGRRAVGRKVVEGALEKS